jgi:spore maturation protein CgeB
MLPSEKHSANRPKILYVTRLNEGSTGFGFLWGFRNLGLTVKELDTSTWLGNWTSTLWEKVSNKLHGRPLRKEAIDGMNRAIVQAADEFQPDLTFFVGAPLVLPTTLQHTSRYGLNFVQFNDDMFNPSCRTYTFFDCIPYWNCVFIPRKPNIEEFKALGVSHVVLAPFAYTPGLHVPVQPTAEEYERYKGDVAFIGSFVSPPRADLFAEIVYRSPNVKFNVWGGGWTKLSSPYYLRQPRRWRTWPKLKKACYNYPLFNEQMSKAMNSNKIVLGLLNHNNRDLHTQRTLEIPACGAFMLMERTAEHLEMFEEGTEAEYFSSPDEAAAKIQYYLAHEEKRQSIAQAGHNRLLRSKYSYFDRASTAIEHYISLMHDA